jgi:hypothetical protein
MEDKKKAKLEVLKELIDMMRSKESESWKKAMKKPEEKMEEESEDSEESCPECGKSAEDCECEDKKGPKKGLGIIIAVEGKKPKGE